MRQIENFPGFSQLYINWLNQIYSNFQLVTGDAIKLNWFPSNNRS